MFELSSEQELAVQGVLDFIQNPHPASPYYVLSGYAGTGKTYCLHAILERTKRSKVSFAFTAPTNKAAKVLMSVAKDAKTIHSLLGLYLDKSGELKRLTGGKLTHKDFQHLDVIIVDEGSMISEGLKAELDKITSKSSLKVLFLGDPAQLPPVKEGDSPIWQLPRGQHLTKVMRHDNQILALATRIREAVNHPAPSIEIVSDNDGDTGVWRLKSVPFKASIHKAALDGLFSDPLACKVIAWRNTKVDEYNQLVRSALWGTEAQLNRYVVGDRIIAAAALQSDDIIIMTTDEEALITGVVVGRHPAAPDYSIFFLTCRTENGRTVQLRVLHPDSEEAHRGKLNRMAEEAKGFPKLWKDYWNFKELFHEVKYAYAITAHRSQGSTYANVWVDCMDILANRKRKEAFQCLYVACTRPSTRLYVQ